MGQPIISYSKKGYISPYNNLSNELENGTKPNNIGTFSPSQPKKATYNSWTEAYKDAHLNYENTLKNNRTGNKSVGKGEIGQTKGVSPDIDPTGIANVTKLRQMGFTPEQIITYTKLIKFNSDSVQDFLKNEEDNTYVEKPTVENVTETGYTAKLEQKKEDTSKSVSFAQKYRDHAMKIATRTTKTENTQNKKEEETLQKVKEFIPENTPRPPTNKILRGKSTSNTTNKKVIQEPIAVTENKTEEIKTTDTPNPEPTSTSLDTISTNENILSQVVVAPVVTIDTTKEGISTEETIHSSGTTETGNVKISINKISTSPTSEKIDKTPLTVSANHQKNAPESATNPFLRRMFTEIRDTENPISQLQVEESPTVKPISTPEETKAVVVEVSTPPLKNEEVTMLTPKKDEGSITKEVEPTQQNLIEQTAGQETREGKVAIVLGVLAKQRKNSEAMSGPSATSVKIEDTTTTILEHVAHKETITWKDSLRGDKTTLSIVEDLESSE